MSPRSSHGVRSRLSRGRHRFWQIWLHSCTHTDSFEVSNRERKKNPRIISHGVRCVVADLADSQNTQPSTTRIAAISCALLVVKREKSNSFRIRAGTEVAKSQFRSVVLLASDCISKQAAVCDSSSRIIRIGIGARQISVTLWVWFSVKFFGVVNVFFRLETELLSFGWFRSGDGGIRVSGRVNLSCTDYDWVFRYGHGLISIHHSHIRIMDGSSSNVPKE